MKSFLSIILSIAIFMVCCFNVTANGILGTAESNISPIANFVITPRYTFLTAVSATIGEKSLGFVLCGSTYTCMYEDYTYTLTCALQRTNGSSAWTDYKTSSETFTGAGANSIEKTWYAPAGYTYRTFTTIVIKNSRTGKVVETATADSPFIYR